MRFQLPLTLYFCLFFFFSQLSKPLCTCSFLAKVFLRPTYIWFFSHHSPNPSTVRFFSTTCLHCTFVNGFSPFASFVQPGDCCVLPCLSFFSKNWDGRSNFELWTETSKFHVRTSSISWKCSVGHILGGEVEGRTPNFEVSVRSSNFRSSTQRSKCERTLRSRFEIQNSEFEERTSPPS